MTTKSKAERRKLIDAEQAKLAAEKPLAEKEASAAVAPVVVEPEPGVTQPEPTPSAELPQPAATRVKAPYDPKPLSGAAEAGKAPKKGQLPAGLLAYLAKKHAGSQVIAAAAAGTPVKKARKAAKK